MKSQKAECLFINQQTMFVQLSIIFSIICLGFVLFKTVHYYFRRYLGFNTIDHIPVCVPGSPLTPTIVCILGWGGCKRRQLRRLIDFYRLNKISTISWINPMYNYIFGVDMKQIERVLNLLVHESRTSKKIVIHLHSNNGALVWGHMVHIMKTNEYYHQLLSNIKGIILDSAPFIYSNSASRSMIQSVMATSRPCVSIILNQAQYFHLIWSPLLIYYLSIRFFYRRYLSSDPTSAADKIRRLLSMTPIDIKQCYLYSDADRLILPSVIGKFIVFL